MLLQLIPIHLLPQSPAPWTPPPLASLWAGPRGTCGGEGTRKASRGGSMSSVPGCKRPLSSVPAGTRGCSSSWCSRTSRGRVATGPRGFLGLCSPHLPRAPSLLRAPVEHLPSRWRFAGLGPPSCRQRAPPEQDAPAATRMPSPARPPRARGRKGDRVLHSPVNVNEAGARHLPAAPALSLLPGLGSVPHGPGQLCHRAGPRSAL